MQYVKLLYCTILYCTVLCADTACKYCTVRNRNSRGRAGACGYDSRGYFLRRTRSVSRGVVFVVPCAARHRASHSPRREFIRLGGGHPQGIGALSAPQPYQCPVVERHRMLGGGSATSASGDIKGCKSPLHRPNRSPSTSAAQSGVGRNTGEGIP